LKLTEQEQSVIEVFKQAGIQGRAFRTQDACFAYLKRTWKPGIMCPGYGREIALEACNWHREEKDSLCLGCDRQAEEGGDFHPEKPYGEPPQRYEPL
jgi:hypothetical protein